MGCTCLERRSKAQPGHEFLHPEGLCQIIIGPGINAVNLFGPGSRLSKQ
jgi:hypothetical protein